MQLTCPSCAATYDVPEEAIGVNGRKIRCRACDTSWFEPGRVASVTAAQPVMPMPTPAVQPQAPLNGVGVTESLAAERPARARRRVPWLLLGLGAAVVGLGAVAATLALGTEQVASRLGLTGEHSPLGISITQPPDWRLIAGGSQLFAVSGRIWNPTGAPQSVPDIQAELRDRQGRKVYSWTIARPVVRLGPGQSASFDGAAVDVPASSANVSVSFSGADAPPP